MFLSKGLLSHNQEVIEGHNHFYFLGSEPINCLNQSSWYYPSNGFSPLNCRYQRCKCVLHVSNEYLPSNSDCVVWNHFPPQVRHSHIVKWSHHQVVRNKRGLISLQQSSALFQLEISKVVSEESFMHLFCFTQYEPHQEKSMLIILPKQKLADTLFTLSSFANELDKYTRLSTWSVISSTGACNSLLKWPHEMGIYWGSKFIAMPIDW